MPENIRGFLKTVRSVGTFWVAEQNLHHLKLIREKELEGVVKLFPSGCKMLEIGGGTGWQAQKLSNLGFDVKSIDVGSSPYRAEKVFDVQIYDGNSIPFPDKDFDVVFSSNVLEHIPHTEVCQSEIYRVLKDDGRAIHLIPSSPWRFWTSVASLIAWRRTKPHGEHASNVISELFYFRRAWWRNMFETCGWKIEDISSNNLFYTGSSIFDKRLSIQNREWLSRVLGGGCNLYVLKK